MGKINNFVLVFFLASVFFVSCESIQRKDYQIKGDYRQNGKLQNFDFSEKVTCSLVGATIEDVVGLLPRGFSVVYDEKLLDVPIFGELRNASYAEFFAVVSKNLNCDLQKIGGVYVFSARGGGEGGKQILSDGAVSRGGYRFFFKLSGIPHNRINDLFQPYKIKYIGSSKYLFNGSVEDAVNCEEIYRNVLDSLPSEYVFDLYFINEDLVKDLYVLDGKTNGSFSLSWNVGDLVSSSGADWQYILSMAYDLGLSYSRSKGFRVLSGVFTEDKPYHVNIGDSIPIITKTVLDSGAVVDSGVSYQDVGIQLTISCEGLSRGYVDLDLSVTDSSGSINGYPIRHGSNIKTCFTVCDEEYHFVGSFFADVKQSKVLGVGRSSNSFYVVCRVRRLSENQSVGFELEKK